MQEHNRYAVGLDVGTRVVRCLVGHSDGTGAAPTIVGVGSAPNGGMRKGVVVNMVHTAQAIDKALEEAERMSGHQIHKATVSINGSHVAGLSSRGVIAVGTAGHEIGEQDLYRAEEAATVVQLPANREILQVTPRSFSLDGQENIKDPVGMTGVRLEVDAYVITALAPHVKNLHKACEMTQTAPRQTIVSALASARAVLNEQQMENGVAVIDLGGTTTNIAVYEEGDLQHVAVIPMGSVNITNDLAIGLKTDLDVAEAVKLQHGRARANEGDGADVTVKVNDEDYTFARDDVDMIVEARLEELFELVNAELKKIGRAAKLPGGVVLVGGGANLKQVAVFAKETLQLPARLGKLGGFSGIADKLTDPAHATVLGLMLLDLEMNEASANNTHGSGPGSMPELVRGVGGKLSHLLKRFRT